MPIQTSAYAIARKFIGLREVHGTVHSPAVLAMLQVIDPAIHDDETAWCSAFVSLVAYLLSLPRSTSLAARSWLRVGVEIELSDAQQGNDVVVLSRGANPLPASVLRAPGHVGFFSRRDADHVYLLGGNQNDMVSVAPFPVARVLGVRRLFPVDAL